jgi:hypothetical protein
MGVLLLGELEQLGESRSCVDELTGHNRGLSFFHQFHLSGPGVEGGLEPARILIVGRMAQYVMACTQNDRSPGGECGLFWGDWVVDIE